MHELLQSLHLVNCVYFLSLSTLSLWLPIAYKQINKQTLTHLFGHSATDPFILLKWFRDTTISKSELTEYDYPSWLWTHWERSSRSNSQWIKTQTNNAIVVCEIFLMRSLLNARNSKWNGISICRCPFFAVFYIAFE